MGLSMSKERLIQSIYVTLISMNERRGRYEKIKQGLEKMDLDELNDLNQLLLSIQSVQIAREQKAKIPYQFFRR